MTPAAAASASPAANRPNNRAATIKLRPGFRDHEAERAPHISRQPNNRAEIARAAPGLLRPDENTRMAAQSPATETRAAVPRGTSTNSGKNNSAMIASAASDQLANRRVLQLGTRAAKRYEPYRSRALRAAEKMPAGPDAGSVRSAASTKDRFQSQRRRTRSPGRHSRRSRIRAPNSPRSIRRNPCGSSPVRHSRGPLSP